MATYLYTETRQASQAKQDAEFFTNEASDDVNLTLIPLDEENPSLPSESEKAKVRQYKLLSSSGNDQEAVKARTYMVAVALTPPEERVSEFEKWYTEEHINMLSKVPGWLRSRRFRLSQGEGPLFLALHDYQHNKGFSGSPEFTAAVTTPWCKDLVGACRQTGPNGYERNVWKVGRTPIKAPDTKDDGVVLVRVIAKDDGESTIVEEMIEMATRGWIGAKSIKYPAKTMCFRQVSQKHDEYLSKFHIVEQQEIQINVDQDTILHTSDGSQRKLERGDMVRFEDVSGKGHRIEATGDGNRLLIVIA